MADPIPLYLFISFLTFLSIGILIFLIKINKKMKVISLFEILSFFFILAGIIYGSLSAFGYALISAGVIFFVADLYMRLRKKR